MADDTTMPDNEAIRESTLMYGDDPELDEKYPNRPHNVHATPPFHTLFTKLFNPLLETNKSKRPPAARRKVGPTGHSNLSPQEAKREIIHRFVKEWRRDVGDDFYPAMRLIVPEKDRDRAMYGLKEKAIAKILVKVTKIDRDSEDAKSMLNWKLPGMFQRGASSSAGDFAGRCYEVLSKRPLQQQMGKMTIAEVNSSLDQLSQVGGEDQQTKIFGRFYRRMNPEELTWLIRIILRQMKIGATEKTFLDIWHPDAETLFNISSNLRRVCWELSDENVRLAGDDTGITLMQCFQPQLAAFQNKVGSFEKMVVKLQPTPDDPTFWIEEKLDGERMQLHMMQDPDAPGGYTFGFWSRKAKDYAYLYGKHFEGDEAGALTRFIGSAFHENVRNIILDGEMITWDMDIDHIVGFGTLKTAAISEKDNKTDSRTGQRPLFRVFDCLYFNDMLLTQYTLRDRRNALEGAVKGVDRRLEIHPFIEATSPTEIEPELRRVVSEASEGLVLKNPRSMYHLNARNDDWSKVKPEYMSEFGESLDCVVVGGYFGSGHRGGAHSSFLCALLIQKDAKPGDKDYEKCWSFFKVGGGFSRDDYASIRGRTEGKWHDWDQRKPPSIIELGGHHDNRQHERPDQWIHPSDSVVLECKAASVEVSDKFRLNNTLRFPRFKMLRTDKKWNDALSLDEFMNLKDNVEREHDEKEKEFKIEQSRRKRARTSKKPLQVAGAETTGPISTPVVGSVAKLFEGAMFYILSDQTTPKKRTKADLEALIKAHGGKIVQRESADKHLIIVAEKRVMKVASLQNRNTHNIVKPMWIDDCIRQAETDVDAIPYLLPHEANRHMFHVLDDDQERFEEAVDRNGDSYTRDISSVDEMRALFKDMAARKKSKVKREFGEMDMDDDNTEVMTDPQTILSQLEEHGNSLSHMKSFMFSGMRVYLSPSKSLDMDLSKNYILYGGGEILNQKHGATHVVVASNQGTNSNLDMDGGMVQVSGLARTVGVGWVIRCWEEGTWLDEERFQFG